MRHGLKKLERFVKSLTIDKYRLVTCHMRPLPDFLIIGSQKSGTTSLYHYLSQHPQIRRSLKKEIHYFDGGGNREIDNFLKGTDWYRSHFPIRKKSKTSTITYEASPLYIFNPSAPKRIAELIPDVKLIALLRNPTERAISHYYHEKKNGREQLPIMEAFLAEEDRMRESFEKGDYKNYKFIQCSYKNRGLYDSQIKRYLEYFPRESLLVISSEKLFSEPENTLIKIAEFLGISPRFTIENLHPRNVASNKDKVGEEVHDYLNEYFRSHNQALYDLIGEDFGWQ